MFLKKEKGHGNCFLFIFMPQEDLFHKGGDELRPMYIRGA